MTDRRAAVRPARRLPRRAASSHSAGDRARHRAARRHRAHDALVDARSAERGLRAHRPRQGPVAGCGSIGVHALRNALLPVVTVIGLSVSSLMAGAVLTETIFSWPGVGQWLIEFDQPARLSGAAGRRDADFDGRHSRQSRSSTSSTARSIRGSAMAADVAIAARRRRSAAAVLAQPTPLAALLGRLPREQGRGRSASRSSSASSLVALFAESDRAHSPIEQFRDAVRAPPVWEAGGSWRFILGTDGDGHDMLSRLIYGARVSLFIGLSVMSVSFVIGVVLGPHRRDDGLGRRRRRSPALMDLIMAVPSLVLAILVVAVLGPSLANTIVAVTIVYLPRYVRLVRASALGELNKDYVTAARVAGVGPLRLMFVDGAAQLPRAADRAGGARRLRRHSRGGGPRLPRPRRAAADAGMGLDARRFARVHPLRPLDRRPCRASPSSSPSSPST